MNNPESPRPDKPIYVTQPFLPPLEEFIPYLEEIWANKILTNGGPLHQRLESALCEYLGVPYISLFNNGTIALITALQALDLKGEVITTPYTFIATTNAIHWNNLKPVFVDIDPETLNIDPSLIEAAITPETTAILPVHCYGTPCDVDAIDQIAKQHGLKVIYDAAHAFGVRCHCGSVLNHGDLSALSFHATKVFNTFEGGAIVSQTAEMKQRIDQLKNFGFANETRLIASGLNGKLSEVHAAMGLLQLTYMSETISRRKALSAIYRERLLSVTGMRLPLPDSGESQNYSYFPIVVLDDFPVSRDELQKSLAANGIMARRYFSPTTESLLASFSQTSDHDFQKTPIANEMCGRILCLPIYDSLDPDLVINVCDRIAGLSRQHS